MKAKDENRVAMWLAVLDFLKGKADLIAKYPALADLISSFSSIIDDTLLLMKLLGVNTSDLTIEKRNIKETLVRNIAMLKFIIRAYAKNNSKQSLFDSMKGSPSGMRQMKDLALLGKAGEIIDTATPILAQLQPYGGSDEFMKECASAKDAFGDIIPKSRVGINELKNNNQAFKDILKKGTGVLDNIDSIMQIQQIADPLLFEDYQSRHKIINVGHRFLSVQFHVVDDATGEPMEGVKFRYWLPDVAPIEYYNKVSKEKGGANAKGLFTGEYLGEATCPDYEECSFAFAYIEGKKIDVTIRMKKKGAKGEK